MIQKLLKLPSTKTGESNGWQNKDDNDDDDEEDDDDDDDKMLLCYDTINFVAEIICKQGDELLPRINQNCDNCMCKRSSESEIKDFKIELRCLFLCVCVYVPSPWQNRVFRKL